MKKRRLFPFAIISLLLILAFLNFTSPKNAEKINLPSLEEKKMKDLTKDKYIEDFEFAYNILETYYPYFDINKKINNIDWLGKKETFKKYIENSKNDVDFGLRMNKILYELNNDHTQIIDQNQAVEMYITYYKMPENDWRHYISHVYEKENVRRRYNLDNKKINDYLKYNQYETKAKINKNNNILGKAKENSNEIRTDNIEAKDINDKIGYLKINSMVNYDYSNYDQKKLKTYLKKAKNKKALVIDIRGNTGGDSRYWQDFLLPQIIDKPYSTSYYSFIKKGDLNKKVISQEKYKEGVSEFLNASNFSNDTKQILSKFDYYTNYPAKISPSEDSIKFKGHIYLLIDSSVFSSAEMLASFCKETKLATIVGSQSKGDGIGTDPLQIDLPNSGYVLRFSKEIGVTESGYINEIEKTNPDINIDSNRFDEIKDQPIIQKIIEIEG